MNKGCLGCLGVLGVLFVIVVVAALMSPDVRKSFSEGYHESSTEPAPRSRPKSIAEQKRDFAASIDHAVTAGRIAGSMFKFVGKHVELSCSVGNIPDPNFFNATCGPDDDPTTIVVEYDTKQLEQGQHVHIYGTVEDPIEGNNAMGGNTHFPTVKAVFME